MEKPIMITAQYLFHLFLEVVATKPMLPIQTWVSFAKYITFCFSGNAAMFVYVWDIRNESTDWFIKYKRKYYWLVIFIKQPARKKTVKKSQVMEILRIHLNLIKVKGDNLM